MVSAAWEKKGRHAVLAPSWIGDTAMAAPFFASLRAAFPEAHIGAVASPWTAGLLEGYPWLDAVHRVGGEGARGRWGGAWSLRGRLGSGSAEAVWLLPNSFRAALLARWIGGRRRVGYATEGRGWLLSHVVPPPPESPPPHLVDYYLGILEGAGVRPAFREARLPVRAEDARAAERLLAEACGADSRPVVGLHPGAFFGESKTWPPEEFASLARRLAREAGARVVVLGGAGEREMAGRVCREAGGAAVSLAGRDDLKMLPALLERVGVLVAGDTGPLHVAALVGTPTVALFGPTDPRRTAPRSRHHRLIRQELECSPCFERTCPLGHHRCMREIGAERVAAEVMSLLAERNRPGFPARGDGDR
ncbi:MAG: lipopolysaccharide heptosyltransferase II [Candidatus Tectomicrobia bacterium]|nr:lipopolysaccharide heptosyltransferase II [Candidatus Tectomicrobia bacterium]